MAITCDCIRSGQVEASELHEEFQCGEIGVSKMVHEKISMGLDWYIKWFASIVLIFGAVTV